jgi:hypothetical protein
MSNQSSHLFGLFFGLSVFGLWRLDFSIMQMDRLTIKAQEALKEA